MPTRWPVLVYTFAGVFLLVWNVLHAGRAVQLQRGGRVTRWLTALCGLLVVPALAIALTSVSAINGRATHIVAFVWPLTTALFLLHSIRALTEGTVRLSVGLPVGALNFAVCASASVRFANALGATLPSAVGAFGVAEATSLGFAFGHAALLSPWALTVPVLTPIVPARWRAGRLVTVGITSLCAAGALLYITEYPRAVRALDSFAPFAFERLQERPQGDFALGVRLLPELNGAPSPVALRNDLALVDTLSADVIEIFVTPSGTRGSALDSVSRALDDVRRDSTLLVVSLGYDLGDLRRIRRNPEGYATQRLDAIDRTMRRLRPDILLPARDPADAGHDALGSVSLSWWTRYLSDATELAHRLRPRTQVGVAASSFSPFDSALFAWASGAQSPLDLAGFTLTPSYGGGASLGARIRIAGHWSRTSARPLWVFGTAVNPLVFGELRQEQAVWGVLAWATSQPRMKGVIVDGAADYDELVGMRAPGGRLRGVVTTFERAQRALAEVAASRP
ncbi:MAG: hypothetical protein ABI877_01540 [Gemmatimonadaceae bacterium]